MSSSAAPLVSTLKELSGRVLNASKTDAQLDGYVLQEQLRILNAESQLERVDADDDDAVANALRLARQALAAPGAAAPTGEGE
jgi:hypothetical protein